MRKFFFSNFTLKLVALMLAIITWFYISEEIRRQAAGLAVDHPPAAESSR